MILLGDVELRRLLRACARIRCCVWIQTKAACGAIESDRIQLPSASLDVSWKVALVVRIEGARPVVSEHGTVPVVRTALLDHVDNAAQGAAELRLKTGTLYLHVLNEVDRNVGSHPATDDSRDVQAFGCVDILAIAGSINLVSAEPVTV